MVGFLASDLDGGLLLSGAVGGMSFSVFSTLDLDASTSGIWNDSPSDKLTFGAECKRECPFEYAAEFVGSSAIPGCSTVWSNQTWPPRLYVSLSRRGGDSRDVGGMGHSSELLPDGGLPLRTFSLVRVSSSTFMGGLGSALSVRSGGLRRRGVVGPAACAEASFSTWPLLGFKLDVDRWTGSDSFRGWVLAGMLDIRRGMTGACCGFPALK
jgi:hypothetical protein